MDNAEYIYPWKFSAHKRLKASKVSPLVKLRKETFLRLKEKRERRKLVHTNFQTSGSTYFTNEMLISLLDALQS